MKKIISICLALLMAAALCGSALAAASVTYEGGAEKFVFLPGSEESDSDLFENFKNVLPGDTITQTIRVQNATDKQVRIYLRAEPVSDIHREFLSQLSLTVDCKNKEIFDAAPSETAQLTNMTLLGTFKKAGSTDLVVTLTVPESLSNQYMGAMGVVPWTFLVEEIPEDPTPHTGDWFQAGLWIGAAALLAAAVIVLIVLQRRRRKEA
ncbi:MAG: hypothetical protein ACI4ML_04225 [Aristaeellaceae bacterium]